MQTANNPQKTWQNDSEKPRNDSDSRPNLESRVRAALIEKYTELTAGGAGDVCPMCGGHGAITLEISSTPDMPAWKHPLFGRAFDCPCGANQANVMSRLAEVFQDSGLPQSHADFTLDTFLARCAVLHEDAMDGKQLAYTAIQKLIRTGHLVDRFGTKKFGLVLSGAPGLGKSGLAAALCNALQAEGKAVLFRDYNDILNWIKDTFEKDRKVKTTKLDILKALKAVPCLVIDDMGDPDANDPKVTQAVRDITYDIIRDRHATMKLTIITTNLPAGEYAERFGQRIARRVGERYVWVDMSGADLSTY